jgi:hypothetical protein
MIDAVAYLHTQLRLACRSADRRASACVLRLADRLLVETGSLAESTTMLTCRVDDDYLGRSRQFVLKRGLTIIFTPLTVDPGGTWHRKRTKN